MFKIKSISKIITYIVSMALFVFTACGTDNSVALNETDYNYINSIYNNMSLWEVDNKDCYCTSFGIWKFDNNIYFAVFYQAGKTETGTIGNGAVSSKVGNSNYFCLTENSLEVATDLSIEQSRSLAVVSAYCEYNHNGTATEKYNDIKSAYIQYITRFKK